MDIKKNFPTVKTVKSSLGYNCTKSKQLNLNSAAKLANKAKESFTHSVQVKTDFSLIWPMK